MRAPRLVLAWVLGLAGCSKETTPPPAPARVGAPGPVTFGSQPWGSAERFVEKVSTSMRRDEGEPLHTESRLTAHVEILDTDGQAISSVRVRYAEEADVDLRAGRGVRGPVHGKAFVLAFRGGELVASAVDATDAGVSPAEKGRLESDFAWLGRPNPWRAATQGLTFKSGEVSVPVARALADTMTVGWLESTATASARYVGTDGGVAEFSVTVDQTMNASQQRRAQAKLTGSLWLRVRNGEFARLDLLGPLQQWEGDRPVETVMMRAQRQRKTSEDFAGAETP